MRGNRGIAVRVRHVRASGRSEHFRSRRQSRNRRTCPKSGRSSPRADISPNRTQADVHTTWTHANHGTDPPTSEGER